MTAIRVLVVGSGGREHALAWRLARDPEVAEVVVSPGNDGMGRAFRRFSARELDGDALARLCRDERLDLAVLGPDAALAAGVSDRLAEAGVPVYGPTRAAARLEWSKWFAKEVLAESGVPAARASRHADLAEARAALASCGPPWVVKADGLAAGKGVLVTSDREEAEAFLAACLESGRFGESGRTVLLEEHLEGEELSLTAVCDGSAYALLPAARDYKRALDGDRGPNTGGMGAYAPAADPEIAEEAARRVVAPVLAAMARRGVPFRGTLYAGLMRTARGPAVLEINARFGDPETQVLLPLLEGSLARLLLSAARGSLDPGAMRIAPGCAVAVALVDQGYPDQVEGGGVLAGLDAAARNHGALLFHAGTAWEEESWKVRGGRAAFLVGVGRTLEEARGAAYAAVGEVGGRGWRCRSDIAQGARSAATAGA